MGGTLAGSQTEDMQTDKDMVLQTESGEYVTAIIIQPSFLHSHKSQNL
jgi:hypothetical protein